MTLADLPDRALPADDWSRELLAMQSAVLGAGEDVDSVMNIVADSTVRLLSNAEGAFVETLEGDDLVVRAASGRGADQVGLRVHSDNSLSGQCIRTGQPQVCEDTETDPRVDREAGRRAGVKSLILVPLHLQGKAVGALMAFSSISHAFDRRDALTLELLTGPLVIGLSGAAYADAERAKTEANRRFAATFDQAAVGIAHVAPDGGFLLVNDRFCEIAGRNREEMLAGGFQQITHPADLEADLNYLQELLEGKRDRYSMEKRYIRKDNSIVWVNLTVSLVRQADGAPDFFVAVIEDITSRKTAEARAATDELTGLLNRRGLLDRLSLEIDRRSSNNPGFAVAYLDLDGFKEVNDSMGHDAGDALLQAFADRLSSLVRSGDLVARIGGDEFALVFRNVTRTEELHRTLESILRRIREPLLYGGEILDCQASMGASLYPQHGHTPEAVLKSADTALHAAKAAGRNCLRVFEPEMQGELKKRRSMVRRARDAITDKRILPYYQPKVNLVRNEVAGFEALLRLRRGNRKGVAPASAIAPAFEDIEVGAAISDSIIQQAINDARRWLDRGVAFGHIAVNVATGDFRRHDFADGLLEKLFQAGVPTDHFRLEVTESVVLGQRDGAVKRVLELLNSEGLKIALDDFGTGYASLLQLKQFPIDEIKIDKSFIHDMMLDANDAAIVRAVVDLGGRLGMTVVAEGVETIAQADYLRRLNCDYGQGFLYSQAVPASQVSKLVKNLAMEAS